MANNDRGQGLISKYVWVIETIYRTKKISFRELNEKWLDDDISRGVEIPKRTFDNWRYVIWEKFDIALDNVQSFRFQKIKRPFDYQISFCKNWQSVMHTMSVALVCASLLVVVSLTVGVPPAMAQPLRMESLPTQALLPVANIHCLMQDNEGFMWYGTQVGLCRDNGYQVEVFRAPKTDRITESDNDIQCMAESRNAGQIWFGTKSGVYILDKRDYTVSPLKDTVHDFRKHNTSDIIAARDGTIWLTYRDSILQYSPSGTPLRHVHSTWHGQGRNPNRLCELPDGNIACLQWDGGWGIIEKESFVEQPFPESYHPNCIVADPSTHCLWVGTWGNGIVRIQHGNQERIRAERKDVIAGSLTDKQIISLQLDPRRNILWCVSMDGLKAYHTVGGILHEADISGLGLDNPSILDHMASDRHGNIWVAGFMPCTFAVLASPVSSTIDPVLSDVRVLQISVSGGYGWTWIDRKGVCLVNLETGLVTETDIFERRPAALFNRAAGGTYVVCGNQILVATNNGKKVVSREVNTKGLRDEIKTACEDVHGKLYIGTADALYVSDGKQLRLLRKDLGVVFELGFSPDGTLWLLSKRHGLMSYSPSQSQWQTFVSDKNFTCLCADIQGQVFVGSSEGNVYLLDTTTKKLTDIPEAANRNGGIVSIIADRKGHIWILSEQSLREWNPQNNASRQLHCDNEIKNPYHFVVMDIGDSTAYVAGTGGIAKVNYSLHLDEDSHGSYAHITAYSLNGKRSICGGDTIQSITMCHGDGLLEIELSTFDILHSRQILMAWRLDSKDAWTTLPAGYNIIRITNLGLGHHKLEVRATDEWGRWGEETTVADIYRKPALWQTWWACLLYVISVVGIVFTVWYLRRRHRLSEARHEAEFRAQTEDLERLREQFAKLVELTADSDNGDDEAPPTQEEGSRKLTPLDKEFIEKVHASIRRNMDNMAYGVEQLSSDLCMSRANLHRKMRMLLHVSPSDYIRNQRLEHAAHLLQTTTDSILIISEKTGFSSASYFTKCFRKKFGVNPSKQLN